MRHGHKTSCGAAFANLIRQEVPCSVPCKCQFLCIPRLRYWHMHGTTHEHTSHAQTQHNAWVQKNDALAKGGTITHARTLLHAHVHANTSTYTDATVRRRTHALRVTQRQPNERVDASDTEHTVGVSVSVGHARTRQRLPASSP